MGRRRRKHGRGMAIMASGALAAALALPGAAHATPADCQYTGASGASWHVGTNWSCNHVPDSDDDVTLDTGDSVLVTANDAVAGTLTVKHDATLAFANTK